MKSFKSFDATVEDGLSQILMIKLCQLCSSMGLAGIKSAAIACKAFLTILISIALPGTSILEAKWIVHACLLGAHYTCSNWMGEKRSDQILNSNPIKNESVSFSANSLMTCLT